MRANHHTQGRNRAKAAPNISLFPFLAVLICTMGALVPLLFAITRQARLQAAQAAAAKIADRKSEIQTEYQSGQWRIEQLKISREKTDEQLADARLELGHLEDHARRLREEIRRHEQTVAELDHLGTADGRQYVEQAEELENIRAQISTARQEVSAVRAAAASRKKSYAIIPFEGPNQTHRRPIYLECRADAVVLQPEGIEFMEDDFEGPLGPGNALASALRAVREYLLARGDFDQQRDGEPYPLLLVRPGGIAAYYAAREAMKSWATEFGYELVDADWKLAYPAPDPQLAEIVRQVVACARIRQERLIAAAPAAYANRPRTFYRASPTHGGFVRENGLDDDEGAGTGYQPRQPQGRIGRNYDSTGAASSEEDVPGPTEAQQIASLYGNAGSGNTALGGQSSASGSGVGSAFAGGSGGGGVTGGGSGAGGGGGVTGGGSGAGEMDAVSAQAAASGGSDAEKGIGIGGIAGGDIGGSAIGDHSANSSLGSNVLRSAGSSTVTGGNSGSAAASAGGTGIGPSGNGQKATAQGAAGGPTLPEGYVFGRPYNEQPTATHQPSAEDVSSGMVKQASPLRPGEWRPPADPPPRPKPEEENKSAKHPKGKPPKNLASKRGRDWGLPDAAGGSVPITRPIKVECKPDQLVILPDAGRSESETIALESRTGASIDAFISAIWEHMDTWGIAGRGMYWRPVLNVYVAPGAEKRFADLQSLLQGSGLSVERK
jgi:hypothetical protein